MISRNVHIHQKFTCGSCGVRLMIIEPNIFYVEGSCSDCGAITKIAKAGFLLEGSSDNICRYGEPVLPLRVCFPKGDLR